MIEVWHGLSKIETIVSSGLKVLYSYSFGSFFGMIGYITCIFGHNLLILLIFKIKEKSLYFLMNEFQILLNLIDFKLIIAVSDGSIRILIVVISTGIDGIIEKFIPIEVLIVFL